MTLSLVRNPDIWRPWHRLADQPGLVCGGLRRKQIMVIDYARATAAARIWNLIIAMTSAPVIGSIAMTIVTLIALAATAPSAEAANSTGQADQLFIASTFYSQQLIAKRSDTLRKARYACIQPR